MKRRRQHTCAATPPEPSEEQRFLEHLWQRLPKGLIEIRVLPNDKTAGLPPKQQWFDDVEEAMQFAAQFDDKRNGYSVYFGVGKRAREGGGKKDVLGVTALWADIDTVNLGWDTERCLKMLHSAPTVLRPTALIHSGGGLHAYWFLKSPLLVPEQTKLIEEANATLARFVSGDNVGNVDRILRLPGSWNAKRGIAKARRCEVGWCYYFAAVDVDDLVRAVEKTGPLFAGPDFSRPASGGGSHRLADRSFGLEPNLSLEELWAKRVRYHATGGKYVGVNAAIVTTTARLHCLGWSDHKVVEEVLRRVKRIQSTQAPYEAWDWEAERETIRRSLERWKPKWKNLRNSSDGERR
jgi:hypothetical protein